ncbi:MAG: hypothetical protein ACSW8B_05530, partial [bacterium]
TNLIPMKIGLVANDGMNIILLKKDANARLAFHQQLTVSSLLSEGYRYKEMDVSLFINDGDPSNSLISTIYLFEIVRLFDEHDFNQAQMKIAALEEYDLLGLHEILLELYRCYLSLIHGDEPSDLSPSAVKLVRTMTVDPIVLATRYGLNLHDENDQDQKKLEKILKNFKRTYPNQGEVTLAFELIALLDETHQKTDA